MTKTTSLFLCILFYIHTLSDGHCLTTYVNSSTVWLTIDKQLYIQSSHSDHRKWILLLYKERRQWERKEWKVHTIEARIGYRSAHSYSRTQSISWYNDVMDAQKAVSIAFDIWKKLLKKNVIQKKKIYLLKGSNYVRIKYVFYFVRNLMFHHRIEHY